MVINYVAKACSYVAFFSFFDDLRGNPFCWRLAVDESKVILSGYGLECGRQKKK